MSLSLSTVVRKHFYQYRTRTRKIKLNLRCLEEDILIHEAKVVVKLCNRSSEDTLLGLLVLHVLGCLLGFKCRVADGPHVG